MVNSPKSYAMETKMERNLPIQLHLSMATTPILILFYVVYFGVSGDYHPVSATQHDSDGETTTFKYSYEFNDNGSVKASKYKYNNSRYWITDNYTYMSK